VIHERLDQSGFLALNAAADVYLDGIAWSGNNTTFEALAVGLPVVTCPGEFIRARHSAAMLTMMGLDDTLAGSLDQDVEIATHLGLDEAWRPTMTEKMRARSAVIYDDEAPIRDLEAFLSRVTNPAPGDEPA
jgi:predicted O-linked N-acetylglucosamine transferase (SPINDLY family)